MGLDELLGVPPDAPLAPRHKTDRPLIDRSDPAASNEPARPGMTRDELVGDPRAELVLLTAKEVARLLRVHVKRVYEEVKDERLVAVRIRGQLRFRRLDLEAYVEANLTRSDAPRGRRA